MIIFTLTPEDMRNAENGLYKHVIIAGGGTGGHLFPGIAVAESFLSRCRDSKILFVSTGNDFEIETLSNAGFDHRRITAEGIKGRGIWYKLKAIFKIPKGIRQSMAIIWAFKPDIVIGMGSYSAGPMVMAAWLCGKKIVLHEQNIIPGITNRLLSRFADRIFVSFKQTINRLGTNNIELTGNPVRQSFLRANACHAETVVMNDKAAQRFTILVIGGSQGAHSINMAIIETLMHLQHKEEYFFIHQTGRLDEAMVKDAYCSNGVEGLVKSFFKDMADHYRRADLVICRAGATTIAEIGAIGASAIFIPFPFAADDHQTLNAQTLAGAGAAEMIIEKDLNGRLLVERIEYYRKNPQVLALMSKRAKKIGNPAAAENIVSKCYRLMGNLEAKKASEI